MQRVTDLADPRRCKGASLMVSARTSPKKDRTTAGSTAARAKHPLDA